MTAVSVTVRSSAVPLVTGNGLFAWMRTVMGLASRDAKSQARTVVPSARTISTVPPPLYWESQTWSVKVSDWDEAPAVTSSASWRSEQEELKPMSLSVELLLSPAPP